VLRATILGGTALITLQIADAGNGVGNCILTEHIMPMAVVAPQFWNVFQADNPTQSEREFQEQKRMFEDIPPLLLLNDYPGQFVISRNGRIADSDYDLDTLVERFFADQGDVPVYMTKIGGEIEELIDTPFFDE
jgi:hypothetical protein